MEELTGAFSLRAARLGVFEVMNGFRCIGSNFHHTADSQEVHSVESPFVMWCTTRLDLTQNPILAMINGSEAKCTTQASIDRAKWTTEKLDKQFSRVRDKFENIEVFQDWSEDDAPPFFSVYNHTEEMDCGHRAASG